MAWLSGALQNARARTDTWKDKVQQGAALVRSRAQQFEEVLAGNLQAPQAAFTAQEVESHLEADARGLFQTAAATETVQRWVMLLRSMPQPRYKSSSEAGSPVARPIEEYTFRQVFLKSNALELSLDAVTRSAELRGHLRIHALRSPEAWPDEKPPPVAFAHAFTYLLRTTIGPPEVWLDFLAVLLSSDRGPADEPCHAWLLQLMAGLRTHWEGANVNERERDLETFETASRQGLHVANQSDVKATKGNITACLSSLAQRRAAIGQVYRAWNLRRALNEDITKAAARHQEILQIRSESASTVASVAAERVIVLDAEAKRIHKNTEQIKHSLGEQVAEVKSKLEPHEATKQQLERELEEVELTQQELMRQIGQLSERRDILRKKLQDGLKQEEVLRGDLDKVDQIFQDRLGREEQAACRIEGARALADAVVNLATGLASPGKQDSQGRRRLSSVQIHEDSSRCQGRAALAALELGEQEVARLGFLAQVVDVCCSVAEERESSREAMASLGVSAATLEADIVGEAEIEQALQDALVEIDRGLRDIESLIQSLEELGKEDGVLLESENKRRAAALAEMLSGSVSQVRSCRERLMTFAPEVEPDECGENSPTTAGQQMDGTIDAFLDGARADGVRNSVTNVGAVVSASANRLLTRFGVGKNSPTARTSLTSETFESDDPFLLDDKLPTTAPVPATSSASMNIFVASVTENVGGAQKPSGMVPTSAPVPATSNDSLEGARKEPPPTLEAFRMDDDDDEAESAQRKSTSSLDPFEPPKIGDPNADPPSLPTPPMPPPPDEI